MTLCCDTFLALIHAVNKLCDVAQSSCKQTVIVSDVLEIIFIDSAPSASQEAQSDEEIWRNYLTDEASQYVAKSQFPSSVGKGAAQCHNVMPTQKGGVVHGECSLITYLHTLFDPSRMPQTEIYIATSKFPCQGCWFFKGAYDRYERRSFCPTLRGEEDKFTCYVRKGHPLWAMPNVDNMEGLEEIFEQRLKKTLGVYVVAVEPFRNDEEDTD